MKQEIRMIVTKVENVLMDTLWHFIFWQHCLLAQTDFFLCDNYSEYQLHLY